MTHQFKFVSSSFMRNALGVSRDVQRTMRERLPSPLYWVKPNIGRTGNGGILWNWELLKHLYLVCNGDRNDPAHRKLVEEYLATLPKPA